MRWLILAVALLQGCNNGEIRWEDRPTANAECIDADRAYFDQFDGELYLVCEWYCAHPPDIITTDELSFIQLWINYASGNLTWDIAPGCVSGNLTEES